MIISRIRSAFRSIFSQKYYAFINIFGLAIGLSAFILIALFVRHELSYDRYHDNVERIYRIVRNEYTCSPPPMSPTLKEAIPEIQYASRFIRSTNLLLTAGENHFTEDEYFWTDNEFFDIFSVKFIQGDPGTILKSPTDIILSESTARKYFGDSDPMGEVITSSRGNEYTVAGIFKDFPSNSHFRFDIVLPIDTYFRITNNNPESWSGNYVYSYVKLKPQTDIASVNEKLVNIEKELVGWTPESGEAYEQYFFFQPVTEIHLHSHRKQEVQVNGDIRNVFIFSSIALLILIIAGINYINLATAMAGNRHKEVGMRKALGIRKMQLVGQFITESILVALLSTGMATIIVILSLSYFGKLMEREMSLALADIPFLIPSLLVLSILVGIATGLIPSRSLSRVSIISVIRGSSKNRIGGKYLRNILIITQFIVALILIILSINVQKQLNYISGRDPGYEKDQIVVMRLFDRSLRSNIQALKDELLEEKNVLDVSTSYELPHKITGFTRPEWFCDDPTDCTPISYNPVDYNFVQLFDIVILEGRNFSKDHPSDASGAFLVNEKAVRMAGWDHPIGKEIDHYDGTKGYIVGVTEDFHFQSLHSEIAPLYLMLDEDVYSYFSIKIHGDHIPATLDHIKSIFNKFSPNTPFQYSFFDEEFEMIYTGEKRLGSIFTFFSVLAIFLGCLGLFGMSAFLLSQRTREMGIRKVYGASNTDIIRLLSAHFMIPVLLANVLAWPVAYLACKRWLEGFAYRTNITFWPFLLAACIVLLITILTISLHSRKIAQQTPASSLKHE